MARRDIEFNAEGTILRGWFYPAEGAGPSAPVVVMAHGFAAVKEMYLDYAEARVMPTRVEDGLLTAGAPAR
jgi:dienelactone hydrolase